MKIHAPQGDESKMNMTPMIDIVFNLVVFFMLSIDLAQKEYVPLELPYARNGIEDKEGEIERLTVNLLPSGDIKFKGGVWALATGTPAQQVAALVALRNELQRLTSNPALRESDRSSKVPLMIHGDRNARWQYVQWIMQVCAEPTIGIYKIQFAVKRPPDMITAEGEG
jgi:biopolymer transport protein ExbD